jgi:hypothetical protein
VGTGDCGYAEGTAEVIPIELLLRVIVGAALGANGGLDRSVRDMVALAVVLRGTYEALLSASTNAVMVTLCAPKLSWRIEADPLSIASEVPGIEYCLWLLDIVESIVAPPSTEYVNFK